MLWPKHRFGAAASAWFLANRATGWATCSITQMGFARISVQPGGGAHRLEDAMSLLESLCAELDHHFWPLEARLSDIHPEIRQRLTGHNQLTDAVLLDLAIRRGGRLVTLDQGIRHLLPAASSNQAAIEIIGS